MASRRNPKPLVLGALGVVLGAGAVVAVIAVVAGGRGDATAHLWVDRDGGSCERSAEASEYDEAMACSWTGAYAAARSDDVIMVKGGSYGDITMPGHRPGIAGITYRPAPEERVTLGRFTNGFVGGADGVDDITFEGPVLAAGLRSDETTDVTVNDWDIDGRGAVAQLLHVEGATRFTLRDSEVHDARAKAGVGGMTILTGSGHVLDRNRFYDALYAQPYDGTHSECIYASDAREITFTRNHLWSCATMDLFITGASDATGWVVENNVFEKPLGPNENALAFRTGPGDSPAPDAFVLRHNTFAAGVQINDFDNRPTAAGFTVVGNYFHRQPPCGLSSTTYAANVTPVGLAGCGSGDRSFPEASLRAGWRAPFPTGGDDDDGRPPGDYRLRQGSPLTDVADRSSYPKRDLLGGQRFSGLAPDVGAFELSPSD